MYLMVLPRMKASGILQKRSPSCGVREGGEKADREDRNQKQKERGWPRDIRTEVGACPFLYCQPRSCTQPPTLDVQMTSRRWMFIQVSHCCICPLYVSPFLSSTSFGGRGREEKG